MNNEPSFIQNNSEPIQIIPSFHYDVLYLKGYEEYLEISFKNIQEALRILRSAPDYTFLIEQVILLQEFWDRFPAERDALKGFAQDGRLAVSPGMYVMPDMNMPSGESFYQQARIGKQWLKENLETDATVCWIADCWGHNAQLPQILSQCGYEYYVFWRAMNRDEHYDEEKKLWLDTAVAFIRANPLSVDPSHVAARAAKLADSVVEEFRIRYRLPATQ